MELYLYSCQVLGRVKTPWNRQLHLHFVDRQWRHQTFVLLDYCPTILLRCSDAEADVAALLEQSVHWSSHTSPVQRVDVENRTPVIGFHNSTQHTLHRVTLDHLYQRRKAIQSIERYNRTKDPQLPQLCVLHTRVTDPMAVLAQQGWRLHSWYRLEGRVQTPLGGPRGFRTTQLHILTPAEAGHPRVAFLRMQAHSSTATRTNQFQPDPTIANDRVLAVHLELCVHGAPRATMVLEDADERTLLFRLQAWLRTHTPSVVVHMSDPFDHLLYLHVRMKRCNLHLSILPHYTGVENRSMHEVDTIRDMTIPGCEVVDLRHVLQKFMVTPNMDGFTLADVVAHPKILRKVHTIPRDIAQELHVLVDMEQDNNFVVNNMALSRSCDLPLQHIVSRGQQTRVFSCFMRTYHEHGLYFNHDMLVRPYLVVRRPRSKSSFADPTWQENPSLASLRQCGVGAPVVAATPVCTGGPVKRKVRTLFNIPVGQGTPPKKAKTTKRYGGGFVIRPVAGFYHHPEHAVCTLDFSSLYPSIMCGYNICFMRVCYDQKWIDDNRATKQYIPLDDETCCVFISHYDGVPVQSITDVLVRDVMTNRTRTRAKMKTVTDPFQHQSLDAQQLCCKVLQNAVYGACGSETFPIMCTALAASVCTIGQWMNKTVRHLALERGCICVYGDTDSVMVQFPTDPTIVGREAILADIYRQARVLEHDATALFPAPNAVEFEALKLPFLMTDRKKTYAAYEFPPGQRGWHRTPTLLIKGFAVKKRDRCPMVQTIGLELIRRLLAREEVTGILPWFREQIHFATQPRTLVDLAPFVISCRLNEVYKQRTVIGPVLADQYEAECGVRPEPGNRLKYVVAHFGDGRKHYQSTMTPEAFLQSGRHLDVAYYLQKQLMLSLQQVLNQHPHINMHLQQCIRAQVTRHNHARRGIQTLHTCIQQHARSES